MGLKDLVTSVYDSAARSYYQDQKESLDRDTKVLSRYGNLSAEQKSMYKKESQKYIDGYNRHDK